MRVGIFFLSGLVLAACGGKSETTTSRWIKTAGDLDIVMGRADVTFTRTSGERRLDARLLALKEEQEIGTAFLRATATWEPLEARSVMEDSTFRAEEVLEAASDSEFQVVQIWEGERSGGLPIGRDSLYSPDTLPGLPFAVCELAGTEDVLRPFLMGSKLRITARTPTGLSTQGGVPVDRISMHLDIGFSREGAQDFWCAGARPLLHRGRAMLHHDAADRPLVEQLLRDAASSEAVLPGAGP